MRERGEAGSIATLLCDRGERYAQTLFDRDWLAARGIEPQPARLATRLGMH
jgi:cysteine synthase A